MIMEEGSKAPDFNLLNTKGEKRTLKDFRGKKLILYFYPKDDTPGCTKEACSLRDGITSLKKAGVVVVGVSPDSVERHQKFTGKYSLPFELLADEDKKMCQKYGVWVEKNMYGRKYMGVARTTFLIDEVGKIIKIFPKVDVSAHADQILGVL